MAKTADAIAREWFERVWNNLDASAITQLMHPKALVYGLTEKPTQGPAEFKPFFDVFSEAFSDIHVDVEHAVVQGDEAAVLCHVTARHTGTKLGPPTGKKVDFRGITILKAKDGQLIEGWNVFDFLTMYRQFGWIGDPVEPR